MDVTATAGVDSTLPSRRTLPASIQRSASRREHKPARAITLAMRSALSGSGPLAARGIHKSREQADIVGVDFKFRMPLDAQTEFLPRCLDPFDDAVR